jgi:hypothetical protein
MVMAKLGTKQRPAIVHVRTEARAMEVASVFNEHGWQFILGIEPDKPENISDLNRLLKSKQVPKAKKVDGQTASGKVRKLHSARNNNTPRRTVRTGGKRKKSSTGSMKVSEERCEYALNTDGAKWHTTISGALSAFFLIMFLTTTSLWYVVLLVLPLLYSLGLFYAIFSNQRVILHGNTITILRRMKKPITSSVADALYQIRVIRGTILSFIFRFDNGRKVRRITPQAYKNGKQFLQQLEDIIEQENIDVNVID